MLNGLELINFEFKFNSVKEQKYYLIFYRKNRGFLKYYLQQLNCLVLDIALAYSIGT